MDDRMEMLGFAGFCLGVALLAAPVLRGAAGEINRTLGTVFPFSVEHCHARGTPGCQAAPARAHTLPRLIPGALWPAAGSRS